MTPSLVRRRRKNQMNPDWVPPQKCVLVEESEPKEWARITADGGLLIRVGDEMEPLDDLLKGLEDES
jgi:hypothetical protein